MLVEWCAFQYTLSGNWLIQCKQAESALFSAFRLPNILFIGANLPSEYSPVWRYRINTDLSTASDTCFVNVPTFQYQNISYAETFLGCLNVCNANGRARPTTSDEGARQAPEQTRACNRCASYTDSPEPERYSKLDLFFTLLAFDTKYSCPSSKINNHPSPFFFIILIPFIRCVYYTTRTWKRSTKGTT